MDSTSKTPQNYEMEPRFPLKDIAIQAGVSLATVDRAVHGRPGVRKVTLARVRAAIGELERQFADAGVAGRRFTIDIVMAAPSRFSGAVRAAFEAELPSLRPAAFSARFHMAESMREQDFVTLLRRIRRRGSHGVVLKAPATPKIEEEAARLLSAKIPVTTLVTDLSEHARIGYIGMDNAVAGAGAAHVLGRMLRRRPASILVTLSSVSFAGEEQRVEGFRRALSEQFPELTVVAISEGRGVDQATGQLAIDALQAHPEISAVYSVGGGNHAVVGAFDALGRAYEAYAAHDLDRDNRALLAAGRLTFVIHHDLRQDARNACQIILSYHRMLPAAFRISPSRIAIATPYDLATEAQDAASKP